REGGQCRHRRGTGRRERHTLGGTSSCRPPLRTAWADSSRARLGRTLRRSVRSSLADALLPRPHASVRRRFVPPPRGPRLPERRAPVCDQGSATPPYGALRCPPPRSVGSRSLRSSARLLAGRRRRFDSEIRAALPRPTSTAAASSCARPSLATASG